VQISSQIVTTNKPTPKFNSCNLMSAKVTAVKFAEGFFIQCDNHRESTDLIDVDRHISCACSCMFLICVSVVPNLQHIAMLVSQTAIML